MTKSYSFPIFLSGLLNFISFFASAQLSTGGINGTVIDSVSRKPVEFMTVALKKGTTAVKTVVTDAGGNFSFGNTPQGKYTIQAIAIGYNSKSLDIEFTGKDLDIPDILVVPQTNNLKEVAIVANPPLIKQEVDRISYDIQADPESKSLTALDMMRKVPLLSLDGDDNIKLKGSGKYKILLNGKPSGMINQSPKDVLRSMPASSIQKIEVITTPPAKYDSEGLSGIINIITTKKIDNGYNGNLMVRENGPVGGPGISGRLTVKQNKLGVNAYGGTGWYIAPDATQETTRITTGDLPTSLSMTGNRKITNNWRYGGAEFSYEADSLNLLTAELNPYSGYNNQTYTLFTDLQSTTGNTSYDQLNRNKYNWRGFDASFNYQLGFKSNKDRMLTFSYKYSNYSSPEEGDLRFTNRINFLDPDYIQNNESQSREQTIQLDYVHPLKKVNIEGGLKGILRDNNSDFEYRSLDGISNQYIVDPARSNKYDNTQNVFGAYNSYGITAGDWSFKAGIRAEGTFVKANFVSSASNVNTNYFNVIPTLSVNRKLKDLSNLNFGYTQRIERPGISFLNPFVDRSNPNAESTGNPDLKAVLSNNFELTYSKAKKGSINAGLSYNFSNNTIQNVFVYDAVAQLTRSTYLNVGKNKMLTANLNINYPITSKWDVSMNGNLGYSWLEGIIGTETAKNSGMTGYANVNSGYKFEHTWKLNASFSYNAPDLLLQGQSNSYYFTSISGSKDIIKDKLTLSAGVNNPYSKFRYYTYSTEGTNFTQNYRSQNFNRMYRVSLSWRFGKLSDEIKKSKRSISNTDVKSKQ